MIETLANLDFGASSPATRDKIDSLARAQLARRAPPSVRFSAAPMEARRVCADALAALIFDEP